MSALLAFLVGAYIVKTALYVRRGRIIRHQANEILCLTAELDELDAMVEEVWEFEGWTR